MPKVKEIIKVLEDFAPKYYQESYDNSGLQVGNVEDEVTGVLIALDCTELIISEAIDKNCNLVIVHHPVIFKGLKKLTGSNYVERTVIKAIQNHINIYAIHTNLDNVINGVNFKIAEKIGLSNIKILDSKAQTLRKLKTFVPQTHLEQLSNALHKAGAGQIGNYKDCSFRTEGIGTFTPNEFSQPFSGTAHTKSFEKEIALELIYPAAKESEILNALKSHHPYEEVAYYLTNLENINQEIGAGAVGDLSSELTLHDFLHHLKKSINLNTMKFTQDLGKKIHKVAVCGGSGSFLLNKAKHSQADVFITSDFKYHEFFDAENQIVIIDIGHYESEFFTKELIYEVISKKIPNIAIVLSEINTNPINYF